MARQLWSFRCVLIAFVFGAATATVAAAGAAIPSDNLLPATTKGYVSIADLNALVDHFNRSQFGQLANDPTMKPFVDSIKRQIGQQGLKQLDQLGFSWDELDGVPGGEVAMATIQLSPDDSAVALFVDVTGHVPQAADVIDKDRQSHGAEWQQARGM